MAYMTSNRCSKSMTYFWVCFRRSAKMQPLHLRPKLSTASPTLKHEEREPDNKVASAAAAALPCARVLPSAAPRSWWDPPHGRGQVSSNPGAASLPPLPRRIMTCDAACLEKLDPLEKKRWCHGSDGAMIVSWAR
jgi:hypothetical protein